MYSLVWSVMMGCLQSAADLLSFSGALVGWVSLTAVMEALVCSIRR
jgi:hypothetical protein